MDYFDRYVFVAVESLGHSLGPGSAGFGLRFLLLLSLLGFTGFLKLLLGAFHILLEGSHASLSHCNPLLLSGVHRLIGLLLSFNLFLNLNNLSLSLLHLLLGPRI